jgi:hypothetical protein
MMTMRTFICLLFIGAAFSEALAKEWRGLVPLRSTRADVERLLGTPPAGRNYPDAVVYHTENEEVLVRYSTGRCIEKWDVPRDTVLFIHVFPKNKPRFIDLKIDTSKYKKIPAGDYLDVSSYDNEEEGFELEVNTVEGLVHIFIYYPPAKASKLRCSVPVMPNKRLQRTGISVPLIG